MLLTVVTEEVPRVSAGERITVDELGHGFFRLAARYGRVVEISAQIEV